MTMKTNRYHLMRMRRRTNCYQLMMMRTPASYACLDSTHSLDSPSCCDDDASDSSHSPHSQHLAHPQGDLASIVIVLNSIYSTLLAALASKRRALFMISYLLMSSFLFSSLSLMMVSLCRAGICSSFFSSSESMTPSDPYPYSIPTIMCEWLLTLLNDQSDRIDTFTDLAALLRAC